MELRKWLNRNDDRNVWKGLAAGLAGGLVASYVMNQFQALWSKASEAAKKPQGSPSASHGGQGQQQRDSEKQEPATVKAAAAISEGVFDHHLTKSEKKVAGPAVHYAMGGTSGAIYGAASELAPEVTVGAGIPFGTAVWLVADEITVPALGLTEPPTQRPLSWHVSSLASHFVYGLTTDLVRRAVRNAL